MPPLQEVDLPEEQKVVDRVRRTVDPPLLSDSVPGHEGSSPLELDRGGSLDLQSFLGSQSGLPPVPVVTTRLYLPSDRLKRYFLRSQKGLMLSLFV